MILHDAIELGLRGRARAMTSCRLVRIERAAIVAGVAGGVIVACAIRSTRPRGERTSLLSAARGERLGGLRDEGGHDLGHRLFPGDHADGLAGHKRAVLDIAVDHRARAQ